MINSAEPEDVRVGSSTTRIRDFASRGPEFDGCTCTRPFLRHVVARSKNLSGSARFMPARYGQVCQLRISTPISSETLTAGRWSVSSSWLTSFGTTTARLVSCQAHTCGPRFHRILCWATEPRRSIQGAYIRRDAESGENPPARMLPETLSRVGQLAKYLLAV